MNIEGEEELVTPKCALFQILIVLSWLFLRDKKIAREELLTFCPTAKKNFDRGPFPGRGTSS